MKVSVQHGLLCTALSRVSGALQKCDDPRDTAQYLVLKADEKKNAVSFTVTRKDFVARASIQIPAAAEGTGEPLLKVSDPGLHTVEGQFFADAMSSYDLNDIIKLDYKESKAAKKEEEEDEDNPEVIKKAITAGTLSATMRGANNSNETYGFQCVSVGEDTTIRGNADNEIEVNAKEFSRFVRQVGLAAGKASFSADWINLLLRIKDGKMTMVTTNGLLLAMASIDVKCEKNMDLVLPYEIISTVAKMCDPELPLKFFVNTTTKPNTVLINQDLVYDNKTFGSAVFKVTCSPDAFPQFQAVIDSVNWKSKFVVKRSLLKTCCDKLDKIQDVVRTTMKFKPAKQIIECDKRDGTKHCSPVVALGNSSNGDDFEVEVSSRHIQVVVDATDVEDLELSFSGRTSAALIAAGPLSVYYSPMKDK